MDKRLHLFGIRHHGPGCAASLRQALEQLNPECVLIEGPPEASELIPLAAARGMRPPLAVLTYPVKNPDAARFFPFADFSPEWCAIQWALANNKAVRFIDAPQLQESVTDIDDATALHDDEQSQSASPPLESQPDAPEDADASVEVESSTEDGSDDSSEHVSVTKDPLGALAAHAGHSDGEAWWSALIEQHAHAVDIFAAIEEAMTALREGEEDQTDEGDRNRLREAYMRLEIRKELKQTSGDIAIVCGAWHTPALREKRPLTADRAVVKGRKAIKTVAHWVPWTEQRLAFSSGYGAGVTSPGWYRHIWRDLSNPENLESSVARWYSKVSRLLRDEGLPASTASAIEASRLATTLAAVRGVPIVGLQELQDASLAAMCHGDHLPLRVIHERLIIGNRVGEVDESVPQPPLQLDLQRWQKKLRLKPEALAKEISLDLRSSAGSLKSALLHRLLILGIPWGEALGGGSSRGTFREVWRLEWKPEFSIQLAEALVHGPTVEQAATGAAVAAAKEETDCASLAENVRQCLLADLPKAAELNIRSLQRAAVNSSQLNSLMKAVLPLIDVLRYGTAREIPEDILRQLVVTLSQEICISLRYGCHQLDDETAREMYRHCEQFDRSVGLLNSEECVALWCRALDELSYDASVPALLRGAAVRTLYTRSERNQEQTGKALSRALSPAVPVGEAGLWLEGFLKESGEILINDDVLFALVDAWLCQLDEDTYIELLPVLRRALSGFDAVSRRHMLERVRNPRQASASAERYSGDPSVDQAMFKAEDLICTILGLDTATEDTP